MRHIYPTIIVSMMFLSFFSQCSGQSPQDKKERLVKQLLKESWEESDKIINLIEPALFLENGTIEYIGCSKLGGKPDLPNSIKWPKFENKPMVFYGQINLEEVAKEYDKSDLPKKGMLYFFSYFKNPENEFGAEYDFIKSKSEYTVIYYENINDDLQRIDFPKDLIRDYHFKAQPLAFILDFQIPPTIETSKVELANLSANDITLYNSFLDKNGYYGGETILGTPYPIQYGADFDWAYSYLEITDYDDPGVKEKIAITRPKFINLLSFSMEARFEAIGISVCYFGIHIEDLTKRKFENVIFIMQDT